jgi:deazaflavin-dependent oxidoreductase (nitroreductase family)
MRTFARLFAPLSRPLAGRRWFPLWAILHHRGRTSGTAYATPVVVRRTADGFVIPMPFGDATQWARNVIAADGCTIHWRGRDHVVGHPATVGRDRAGEAFTPLMRAVMGPAGIEQFLVLQDAA